MSRTFTIEQYRHDWRSPVLKIAARRLGRDYLDPSLLDASLDPEAPHFTRCAITDPSAAGSSSSSPESTSRATTGSRGDILGFGIGAVLSRSELLSYLNVDRDAVPDRLRAAERTGVLRTVAVRATAEGRGVATALTAARIKTCADRGAERLCAVGWREGGSVNVGGIMAHFGFEAVRTYDAYWREESERLGYHCDGWGPPPCTCAAVLFVRDL